MTMKASSQRCPAHDVLQLFVAILVVSSVAAATGGSDAVEGDTSSSSSPPAAAVPIEVYATNRVKVDYSGSPWGADEAAASAAGAYVAKNNIITGVNAYKGTTFVCVPRWRSGVPATLAYINQTTQLLVPFPSWAWQQQQGAAPIVLHYVQSVFLDQRQGLMWVIDTGRENFADPDPAKLVNRAASLHILDLNKHSLFHDDNSKRNIATASALEDAQNGFVQFSYTFSDAIFPHNSSFLNDIKVDATGRYAFMSDTNTAGLGAVVVFDRQTNYTRRFQDTIGLSTFANPNVTVEINGVSYPSFKSPADGIALSVARSADDPADMVLYYSSVQGCKLHAISTKLLLDPSATDADLSRAVRVVSDKQLSPSDGLLLLPIRSPIQSLNPKGLYTTSSSRLSGDGPQHQEEEHNHKDAALAGSNSNPSLDGVILYGANNLNTISAFSPSSSPQSDATEEDLFRDDSKMQWTDTFALISSVAGGTGEDELVVHTVLCTTNKLQLYFTYTLNVSDALPVEDNFRVYTFNVTGSALHPLPSGAGGGEGKKKKKVEDITYAAVAVLALGVLLLVVFRVRSLRERFVADDDGRSYREVEEGVNSGGDGADGADDTTANESKGRRISSPLTASPPSTSTDLQ